MRRGVRGPSALSCQESCSSSLEKEREVPRVRNPNQEGRKTLLGGHQVKISWGPCKNVNILRIIDYSFRKKPIDRFKILVCLGDLHFFCKPRGVFDCSGR